MKIVFEKTNTAFTPVHFHITIESHRELEVLKTMFSTQKGLMMGVKMEQEIEAMINQIQSALKDVK